MQGLRVVHSLTLPPSHPSFLPSLPLLLHSKDSPPGPFSSPSPSALRKVRAWRPIRSSSVERYRNWAFCPSLFPPTRPPRLQGNSLYLVFPPPSLSLVFLPSLLSFLSSFLPSLTQALPVIFSFYPLLQQQQQHQQRPSTILPLLLLLFFITLPPSLPSSGSTRHALFLLTPLQKQHQQQQ